MVLSTSLGLRLSTLSHERSRAMDIPSSWGGCQVKLRFAAQNHGKVFNDRATSDPGCARSSGVAPGGFIESFRRRDSYNSTHRKSEQQCNRLRFYTLTTS